MADSYYEFLSSEGTRRGARVHNLNCKTGAMERTPIQAVDSGPVGAYAIDGATVFGAHYIGRAGGHIYMDRLTPTYIPNFIRNGQFPDAAVNFTSLHERKIDAPVMLICARQAHIYGHFLLEMLPKLLFANDICRNLDIPLHLIIEESLPTFARHLILRYAPEAQFIPYDKSREYLTVRKLIVPTTIGQNYFFHSAIKVFFLRMREAVLRGFSPPTQLSNAVKAKRGIFLSRQRLRQAKGWDSRVLRNAAELERAALDLGLLIIEPQELSLPEQVYLFSEATLIVGEFSSGLHNAIFRHSEARVIAFDRMNNVQERIAQLCSHNLIHLIPRERLDLPPQEGVFREFTIPLSAFETALAFE